MSPPIRPGERVKAPHGDRVWRVVDMKADGDDWIVHLRGIKGMSKRLMYTELRANNWKLLVTAVTAENVVVDAEVDIL